MIIRGTTPTIKYTFKTVDVENIADAYLTITSNGEKVVDRNDFDRGEDWISWTLTQEETLSFGCAVSIVCNWLLSDGTRGTTTTHRVSVEDNPHDEVM